MQTTEKAKLLLILHNRSFHDATISRNMSDAEKPVQKTESSPLPPPKRGGGFFTFLLALCAIGAGLYLYYGEDGLKKINIQIPRSTSPMKTGHGEDTSDQNLIDSMGAMEERISNLESATSQIEDIIEQLGQEVGSVQGISDTHSSIPLYSLRINLADIRLRISGNPELVIDELRQIMSFIPADQVNVQDALGNDIDRLGELPSKAGLIKKLDQLKEALAKPLIASEENVVQSDGVLGVLLDLMNARKAEPPQQANLLAARRAVGNARTLILIGDSSNYTAKLNEINDNVQELIGHYDQESLSDVTGLVDELITVGLPEYSLAAADGP